MRPAPTTRRTPDGAIDYDFYRARVRIQRDRALREAFAAIAAQLRSTIATLCGRRLAG